MSTFVQSLFLLDFLYSKSGQTYTDWAKEFSVSKKKDVTLKQSRNDLKKQQNSCLWQQMYLPPAWATDSQTSVGTLSSARFYGWERVLLGFLWAPARPRGPSYVLRKITQAPPPVIKMSYSIFVTSWWFAVIYKHSDACLSKTRILIKGFHLKNI